MTTITAGEPIVFERPNLPAYGSMDLSIHAMSKCGKMGPGSNTHTICYDDAQPARTLTANEPYNNLGGSITFNWTPASAFT